MMRWRTLWVALLVLSLLLSPGQMPAVGKTARPGQLAAEPPYVDWFDESGRLSEPFQGFTSSNGYFYASTADRVLVLDESNLNVLHEVGRSIQLSEVPLGLAVSGEYLYVITDGGNLLVFDLQDPRKPALVNAVYTGTGNKLQLVPGGLAALNETGLRLISLSDPLNPQVTANFGTGYIEAAAVDGSNLFILSAYDLYRVNLSGTPAIQTLRSWNEDNASGLDVRNGLGVLVRYRHIEILDFSNPANPQLITTIYQRTMSGGKAAIAGQHAYIADYGALRIIDLSSPAQARLVAQRQYIGEQVSQNISTLVEDGRLYILDPEMGVAVLDLSQPTRPALAAYWGKARYTALARDGSLLFAANSRGRLEIWDVSDPDRPALRGQLPTAGGISLLAAQGGRALISGFSNIDFPVMALDVSNPANPLFATGLDLQASVYGMALNGNYGYVLLSGPTLKVVDLSNIYNAQVVHTINLSGSPENLAVGGGHLFIVERNSNSLLVYSLANPAVPAYVTTFAVNVGGSYNDLSNLAYLAPHVLASTGDTLAVINVQNPASPVQVSLLEELSANPDTLITGGERVILTGWEGMTIVDLADPANPATLYRTDIPGIDALGGGALAGSRLYLAGLDLRVYSAVPAVVHAFIPDNYSQAAVLESPLDDIRYDFEPYSAYLGFFSHTPLAENSSPPVPAGLGRLKNAFQNSRGEVYTQDYQFEMTYTTAEISGLNEASLKLYFWDGQDWVEDPTSAVNAAANTLTAAPDRVGIWMVAGETVAAIQDTTTLNLPMVLRALPVDLSLNSIEVTQAVQRSENTVPLVQNRGTLLRANFQTSQPGGTRDVYLSVSASRNGQALPGSPITSGPWTAQPGASRALLEGSASIRLPQDWLNGSVTLTVHLDPQNRIGEENEGNNELSTTAVFNPVPPLHIVLVPVRYTHTPTGQVFDPITSDSLTWRTLELYPVPGLTVELHTPINFSGSLPDYSSWNNLLNTVTSLKNSEGRPSGAVYYAAIDAPGTVEYGIVGLGWLGLRASVGINDFDVMAHEAGHNFNLEHTFSNGAYPYAADQIGQMGVSFDSLAIYPANFFADVMSYNNYATWISDYHYQLVYNNQRSRGAATSSLEAREAVLAISGTISGEGQAAIQPVYVLPGLPLNLAAEGRLQAVLYAANGRELARHPLEVFRLPETEGDSQTFNAALPLPSEPAAWVRVFEGETLLAERALNPAGPASLPVEVLAAETGLELVWTDDGRPVMVRASLDGGQTWQVLAVDLTGGRYAIRPEWFAARNVRFQVLPADLGSLDPASLQSLDVDLVQ